MIKIEAHQACRFEGKASIVVFEECLGVKANEKVLIVTNNLKVDIGKALYEAACDLETEGMIIVMWLRLWKKPMS